MLGGQQVADRVRVTGPADGAGVDPHAPDPRRRTAAGGRGADAQPRGHAPESGAVDGVHLYQPPWARAMERTMASPRPVPPAAPSPRAKLRNGSKIARACRAGTPGPWSAP